MSSGPRKEILGMISPAERSYLREFAKVHYSGEGALVDLGCWLGASTIELAKGLRENPHATGRANVVHAYDRFVWEAWMDQFVARTQLSGRYRPGDSFYQECVNRTYPWKENIQFHPGDLNALGWNGSPIEFLFVDAMKSWTLANSILSNFFSALIPGRSVVVHQDFAHFGTHWIHLIMYRLRNYFEPVHDIPHSWSIVFRYREAIPSGMLVDSYSPALFSIEEVEAAFEYSSSIVAFEKQAQIVGAKVMALLERGDVYRAWKELEHAKAASLSYADLDLPLGLWFPSMIMGELGRKQMEWEAISLELDGLRRELKKLRAEPKSLQLDCDQLRTSVEAVENLRRELDDTRVSLQQARELIESMQSTKLGKLKKSWYQFKRVIGSTGSK